MELCRDGLRVIKSARMTQFGLLGTTTNGVDTTALFVGSLSPREKPRNGHEDEKRKCGGTAER